MAYVMIVDDDQDFASVVSKVVHGAGHETKTFLDTKSAAKSIDERTPDLLILDVMFPENDSEGFDFARQLKAMSEKKNKKFPILMLTGINAKFPLGFNATDIDDAWMPVNDFLEKPVDLDILKNRVDQLLKKTSSK